MQGNTFKGIDLSYFLASLHLSEFTEKADFFNGLNKTPEKTLVVDNLFEILTIIQRDYDRYLARLENFKNSPGLSCGCAFTEPNTYEYTAFNFLSLLNYVVKNKVESQFSKIKHEASSPIALVYYQGKLSIAYKTEKGSLTSTKNPIVVDFINGGTAYRVNNNVRSEAAVKAVLDRKLDINRQYILDATGGFGQDAILFANAGLSVLIFERNVIIGLLLADGLRRLKEQTNSKLNVSLRFPVSITEEGSRHLLEHLHFTSIYLDPMYPHKESSAKVNKNMQAIQEIVGQDLDADELLVAASQLNTNRIVVKRPKSAPYLNNQTTNDAITTKSHRFDLYYLGKANLNLVSNNFAPEFSRKDILFPLKNLQITPEQNTVTFTNLQNCALEVNKINLQQESFYAETGKYHSTVVAYSRLLKRETIMTRSISYQIYLENKDEMLANPVHQTSGDLEFRYQSLLYVPDLREQAIVALEKLKGKATKSKSKLSKTLSKATKSTIKNSKTSSKKEASKAKNTGRTTKASIDKTTKTTKLAKSDTTKGKTDKAVKAAKESTSKKAKSKK